MDVISSWWLVKVVTRFWIKIWFTVHCIGRKYEILYIFQFSAINTSMYLNFCHIGGFPEKKRDRNCCSLFFGLTEVSTSQHFLQVFQLLALCPSSMHTINLVYQIHCTLHNQHHLLVKITRKSNTFYIDTNLYGNTGFAIFFMLPTLTKSSNPISCNLQQSQW